MLAERAPDLHQVLAHAAGRLSHLVMDGKIFATDRCPLKIESVKDEIIDEWYSGKTSGFGGNIQALFEPDGFPIWTSDVDPGHVVDIEAARIHLLPAAYPHAKTMPILADSGYQDAGHGTIVPFKQPTDGTVLSPDNRSHNALQHALRCLGERGFAIITERWNAPTHTTLSPSRISDLVRAAHVLTPFRTPPDHLKITEKTSLRQIDTGNCRSRLRSSGRERPCVRAGVASESNTERRFYEYRPPVCPDRKPVAASATTRCCWTEPAITAGWTSAKKVAVDPSCRDTRELTK